MEIIQNEKEYNDLVKLIEITEVCHRYEISEEDRLQALSNAGVSSIANTLIKRIGLILYAPKDLIDSIRKEYEGDRYLGRYLNYVKIMTLQEYLLRQNKIQNEFSEQEREILIDLVSYYTSLKGSTDELYYYEFNLDWGGVNSDVSN